MKGNTQHAEFLVFASIAFTQFLSEMKFTITCLTITVIACWIVGEIIFHDTVSYISSILKSKHKNQKIFNQHYLHWCIQDNTSTFASLVYCKWAWDIESLYIEHCHFDMRILENRVQVTTCCRAHAECHHNNILKSKMFNTQDRTLAYRGFDKAFIAE